jgi:hypothetical protein
MDGTTALMLSVINPDAGVLEYLLKTGARVNYSGYNGMTALGVLQYKLTIDLGELDRLVDLRRITLLKRNGASSVGHHDSIDWYRFEKQFDL